jgi:hypothetical protein
MCPQGLMGCGGRRQSCSISGGRFFPPFASDFVYGWGGQGIMVGAMPSVALGRHASRCCTGTAVASGLTGPAGGGGAGHGAPHPRSRPAAACSLLGGGGVGRVSGGMSSLRRPFANGARPDFRQVAGRKASLLMVAAVKRQPSMSRVPTRTPR